MSEATIIYPHQLFADSPAVKGGRPIYLIEEPLLLTHNPIHRQKLIFHTLTMDAYERALKAAGHTVTRLTIHKHPATTAVFERLKADGISLLHIVDTTDDFLERAIANAEIERVWYDSPLFILPKAEAIERYRQSKRHMARFYKQLRIDRGVLIDTDGKPTGGKWSFDEDNRQKLPKHLDLPAEMSFIDHPEIAAAVAWAEGVPATQYGAPGCWLPCTTAGAEEFLAEFLRARFTHFGPYEDALSERGTRLFHSTLSPLLNVGLLTPTQVLDAALAHATTHDTPHNSLEGFVRQILGWREFIRAAYESDGRTMRSQNFWSHSRPPPPGFWTGETAIPPIDRAIDRTLSFGYTHHIERLMVLGNFLLLTETDPHEVYRWFMAMYLDAYDWVMVPNVYGMSQFADGGSFATKPYISGSNYLKKMSDYPGGDWEDLWTALYWHFIHRHQAFFKANHRLSMMPQLLTKMSPKKRAEHLRRASSYLQDSQ